MILLYPQAIRIKLSIFKIITFNCNNIRIYYDIFKNCIFAKYDINFLASSKIDSQHVKRIYIKNNAEV